MGRPMVTARHPGNLSQWRRDAADAGLVRGILFATRRWTGEMILLGVVLLIIGFIAKIAIVWAIGILLVLVGLALVLLGALGRAVGGRRHYD